MTKLNLFLGLMDIIHNLHEGGITSCAAYEALIQINSVFDNFEENDGVGENSIHKVFEDVFFTTEYMPEELQQYFHTVENFHSRNKIHLKTLPPRVETTGQAELMAGLFNTLNELLEAGVTSCNNYQARMKINDLFLYFLEVDDTPQAEYLESIFEDEIKDTINNERLSTLCDYIAIKQERIQDLPQVVGDTREQRQLKAGLFGILMDSIEPDVTSFNAREAFRKIDALFLPLDQRANENQEMADDENEDSLCHFFPDVKENLDKLIQCPFIKRK